MANLSTQNIGTNFKGMLNLGSTINTPLSTTLQAITDGDGVASPLQLATNRIALGTSTGTSLLNFPDAGTTSADGISFGASLTNLYRSSSNSIKTDGGFVIGAGYTLACNYIVPTTGGTRIDLSNTSGEDIRANTLTGSSATSALAITQTWNTTGNPTAIFANITNTASGSTSNLMDLQVGGVSQFKVSKAGNVTTNQYRLSAMNTAPSSASDTGTLGEIRITATYIYVCTSTNTWVRSALATW